jgi:hypothetical protein
MRNGGTGLLLVVGLALGFLIAWVDSRPNWDDTGITAGALFAGAALLGALQPAGAWRWALAVGFWIPARGIALHGNYGLLLVLLFPLAGAYAGALARRWLSGAMGAA